MTFKITIILILVDSKFSIRATIFIDIQESNSTPLLPGENPVDGGPEGCPSLWESLRGVGQTGIPLSLPAHGGEEMCSPPVFTENPKTEDLSVRRWCLIRHD